MPSITSFDFRPVKLYTEPIFKKLGPIQNMQLLKNIATDLGNADWIWRKTDTYGTYINFGDSTRKWKLMVSNKSNPYAKLLKSNKICKENIFDMTVVSDCSYIYINKNTTMMHPTIKKYFDKIVEILSSRSQEI